MFKKCSVLKEVSTTASSNTSDKYVSMAELLNTVDIQRKISLQMREDIEYLVKRLDDLETPIMQNEHRKKLEEIAKRYYIEI